VASAFFTYRQKVTASKAASPCEEPRRAFKYDAFWSYSAKVLGAIQGSARQPVGGFDFSTGTGTIAINLTSGASGATKLNPNGSGVNFQNPVEAANGKDYSEPAALNGGTSTGTTTAPRPKRPDLQLRSADFFRECVSLRGRPLPSAHQPGRLRRRDRQR